MTAVSEFDREIAVTGRADQPGAYDAELGEGWRIGGGSQRRAAAGASPAAPSARARPGVRRRHTGPSGPAGDQRLLPDARGSRPGRRVRTSVVRRGRAVSTGQVSLLQRRRRGRRGRAGALPGDLRRPGLAWTATRATSAARRSSRRRTRASRPPRRRRDFLKHASLLDRLDLRLDPATTGWAVGKPSGQRRHPRLAAHGRRARAGPAHAAPGGRRAAAGGLRARPAGLDAHAGADRPRSLPARAGLAAGQPHEPHPVRRLPRGGRRGLGQRRAGWWRCPGSWRGPRLRAGRILSLWLSLSESSVCPTSASRRCSTR